MDEVRSDPTEGGCGSRTRRRESGAIAGGEPKRRSSRGELGRGLLRDLVFAARMLRKRPGFTTVAMVTLALGIGATTTIFTLINGILLTPLPYEDPDELVVMHEALPEQGMVLMVSYPNFLDWREQGTAFDGMAAMNNLEVSLTGQGDPVQLAALRISASTFDVLGVRPIVGRGFLEEEDRVGGERVVILSHGMWQERFGPNQVTRGLVAFAGGVVAMFGARLAGG